MVALNGLTCDRHKCIAFLDGVGQEAIHHFDGIILDIMAQDEGIVIGVNSVHHVLIHDISVSGIARVAACDVPVDVGVAFVLGFLRKSGHDPVAVVGADCVGTSAGKAEEISPAAGLFLDDILCYVGQNMIQSGSVAARMLDLFMKRPANIGIISCHNMLSHEQRERSFIDCVEQQYPDSRIHNVRYILETPEDAYSQTMEMLKDNPEIDSLFITCGCVTDICRAVRDYRSESNSDTQPVIICYEKYPEILSLIKSSEVAYTLNGGLTKQGRFSMRVLFEYLVYDREPEKKKYYFNNKILIRENC